MPHPRPPDMDKRSIRRDCQELYNKEEEMAIGLYHKISIGISSVRGIPHQPGLRGPGAQRRANALLFARLSHSSDQLPIFQLKDLVGGLVDVGVVAGNHHGDAPPGDNLL